MPYSSMKLYQLNKQGFIPQENENEEAFIKRAESTLSVAKNIESIPLPNFFKKAEPLLPVHIKGALQLSEKLYDITPHWVPTFFTSKKLTVWQGAKTWTAIENKQPKISVIQLHSQLKEKSKLWGAYSREELLSHEFAHIGRSSFSSIFFEELIAYQSSPYFFRRFFGPIVQKPWEVILMFIIFFISFIGQYYSLLTFSPLYSFFFYIPYLFIGVGFIRLFCLHWCFNRVKKRITPYLKNDSMIGAVLYRLSDYDFFYLGFKKNKLTNDYLQNRTSLRWRLLKEIYFFKCSKNSF